MSASRRAVFLDRDGVLNRAVVRDGKPYPPDTLASLEILPGVAQALEALRAAGYLNIVVTNQPDVATGKQRRAVVDEMHAMLARSLALDDIKVCFHTDGDGCMCRKPKPGMILEAAAQYGVNLTDSFLVGDRWRDISAAHAAGCKGLFIDYGYGEKRPDKPYLAVKSLPEAAGLILSSAP